MKKKELLKLFVSKGLVSVMTAGILIGLNPTIALAENYEIEWEKCLGGSGIEVATSVQQTDDGEYIVAGYTESSDGDVDKNNGGRDYWIVKIKSNGDIDWEKSLGGSGRDVANSIKQTDDGGYIVAGYTESSDGDVDKNNGGRDCWIVKLKSNGDIDWEKSLGGSGRDVANSIQQTDDGGYIIAGDSNSTDGDVTGNHGGLDYWIVKLKSNGDIDWEKSIGYSGGDIANSIQQTDDGGYIISGSIYSTARNADYFIVKLDSSGEIIWEKNIGGTSSDTAYQVQQTSDSGYIIVGSTYSTDGDVSGNHGGYDVWIIKLDSNGEIDWKKCIGGSESEGAYSVQVTKDGGYIIQGDSESKDYDVTGNHGDGDYWIVKLDSSGHIEGEKSFGGSELDSVSSEDQILQTIDGGYIISGQTKSTDGDVTDNHGSFDCWIVKLGITNSSINLETAVYDKCEGAANNNDVNVLFDLKGNKLSSIKNGADTLTEVTDYVTTGSSVTINKSYLNTLPVGTANLIFNFSGGAVQSLNIQISDTTPIVNPPVVPPVDPGTNDETTTPAGVKIIGTERVGKTLEAVLLTDSGAKFTTSAGATYEWYRLSSSDAEDGTLVGNDETYRLVSSDKGKYIKVIASYDGYTFEKVAGRIAKKSSSSSSSSSSSGSSSTSSNNSEINNSTNASDKSKGSEQSGNVAVSAQIPNGWQKQSDGTWKYGENGQAVIGWKKVNGIWYSFTSNGIMETGFKQEGGKTYYLDNEGAMATGWELVNGSWYLFDNAGAMLTGWQQADGKWYYLNPTGVMATGWINLEGKWYYLYGDGSLAVSTVINGYTVDQNGVWV